jgi:hypothetical protein
MSRKTVLLIPGAIAVAGLALTGCATGEADATGTSAPTTATGALSLADVCEPTVTVQLQWQPQSDMGALFTLLGDDFTVDADAKSVTGSLIAQGEDTGIDLELRAGGPAIGFQSVMSQLYLGDDVDLGLVHGDELVVTYEELPVVAVTPLLTYTPQMLMWDPETHGEDFSIADVAATGSPVVVAANATFAAWLVAQGYVTTDQVDSSYDGSPARFASDPSIIQQGFANSEPYTYEFDTEAWMRPIGFELLRDAGYDIYASNVSVRPDRLEELTPCLTELVPIIQQATVDYLADPSATNQRIVDVVETDGGYYPYSIGEADFGAGVLVELGLIANENGTVGGYDLDRAQATIDWLIPVLQGAGATVPDSLPADAIFTTQFIDPSIALP